MKLDDQDIGELFKDAFDGFEANVQGNPWNNIQSRIDATGAGASSGGAASGSAFGKIASWTAITITSAGLGAGAFYFFSGDENVVATAAPAQEQHVETVQAETAPEVDNAVPIVVEPLVVPAESENLTPTEQQQAEEEKQQADPNKYVITEESEYTSPYSSVVDMMWTSPKSDYNNGSGFGVTQATSNGAVEQVETPTTNATIDESTAEAPVVIESVDSELPTAYIEASVVGGYAPLEVDLRSGFEASKYTWIIDGNEVHEMGRSLTETFAEPGSYTVKLVVENEAGAEHYDMLTIEVEGRSYLPPVEALPNVITPNGDDINDEFIFEAHNIGAIYVAFYDRAGKVVFESDSFERLFKGYDQGGNPLEEGTYFYIIRAVGVDGNKIERKGTVTLTR